ncbi:hypothetical protein [Azohydromonas australica]|uniref:hypothetical protein n=1 Tax=Azohydromonas australica TaxID=364039 RepID=UPI0012EB6CE6|nr:hypothetical protein [Azohydromonas australica]
MLEIVRPLTVPVSVVVATALLELKALFRFDVAVAPLSANAAPTPEAVPVPLLLRVELALCVTVDSPRVVPVVFEGASAKAEVPKARPRAAARIVFLISSLSLRGLMRRQRDPIAVLSLAAGWRVDKRHSVAEFVTNASSYMKRPPPPKPGLEASNQYLSITSVRRHRSKFSREISHSPGQGRERIEFWRDCRTGTSQ